MSERITAKVKNLESSSAIEFNISMIINNEYTEIMIDYEKENENVFNKSYSGRDLFDALSDFRREIEPKGYRLLCNAAKLNAWPSGMSRNMSGGRKIYLTEIGKPAYARVDLFGEIDVSESVLLEEQIQYHGTWIRSLEEDII